MPMNIVPISGSTRRTRSQVCGACEVRRTALFGALDDATLDRIHAHVDDLSVQVDGRIYGQGEAGGAVYTIRWASCASSVPPAAATGASCGWRARAT